MIRHSRKMPPLAACAAFALNVPAFAQNLPDEYYISDDGRRLIAGGLEEGGIYAEDTVVAFYLTFAQADFWDQLVNNYDSGTPIMATLTYDGQTYDSVGVKFKGETSYFALPNGSEKMSFDITMDEWIAGQDLHGYDGINLNNGFQDNSVMRDVVYKHLIRPHVPAARACFAKLYINGQNWGLYDMVQDLDGDFIKQWWFSNDGSRWRAQRPDGQIGGGQWGDGTAALNYLGSDTADYQQYYTLKHSNVDQPWDDLVITCDKLNNTPIAQLYDTLDAYMDVDRVLWHLACENAFADDDSYIHKGKSNYSLYWEPETGRMTSQEIDGNSVLSNMNLSWSPFYHADDVNYPLLYRLMQVPKLRQRYLAHLRTVITTSLDGTQASTLTNTYKTLIDTIVQNDPKKLMTYSQFTSGVTSLANAFNTRRNNLLANTEVAQLAPSINNVEHEVTAGVNEAPGANELAHVRGAITSTNGISAVMLYWSTQLPGRFQHTEMLDDGAHNDGAVGDGTYGADIPGQQGGSWVRYYVEATSDNTFSASYAPAGAEHDVYLYQVVTNNSPNDAIVINEIMASNSSTASDENGQFEDWIELYNAGNAAVDLQGWYLTDTPFEPTKWQLPGGTVLAPDGYMIVWADEDASQGAMHANFKLSASGESVLLFDADTLLVDQLDFGDQITDQGFARVPNGSGPFIIQTPTFAANNNNASIEESGPSIGLRVYPNPATTQVVLVWNDPGPQSVSIIDAMQRTVWSGTLRPGSSIDLSALAAGTYVVRLAQGSTRLVVVR